MTTHRPYSRTGATSSLRACGGCSAHILTNDTRSRTVYCATCTTKRAAAGEAWAAGVKPGDCVFLQPCAAWRGLSHSEYLVVRRDDNKLTVEVLGIPASRQVVDIALAAERDMTPRHPLAP